MRATQTDVNTLLTSMLLVLVSTCPIGAARNPSTSYKTITKNFSSLSHLNAAKRKIGTMMRKIQIAIC